MIVEICGKNVPVKEEVVVLWMAKFKHSWTCPITRSRHAEGETMRCPGDPKLHKYKVLTFGNRHHGTEYDVPFDVLEFQKVQHTIYSLRHKVTKTIEWNPE